MIPTFMGPTGSKVRLWHTLWKQFVIKSWRTTAPRTFKLYRMTNRLPLLFYDPQVQWIKLIGSHFENDFQSTTQKQLLPGPSSFPGWFGMKSRWTLFRATRSKVKVTGTHAKKNFQSITKLLSWPRYLYRMFVDVLINPFDFVFTVSNVYFTGVCTS